MFVFPNKYGLPPGSGLSWWTDGKSPSISRWTYDQTRPRLCEDNNYRRMKEEDKQVLIKSTLVNKRILLMFYIFAPIMVQSEWYITFLTGFKPDR